jgi:hypothetical protein
MQEEFTGHGFYVTVPMALLKDPDVSAGAKLCFGLIANLANHRGYCFATNDYIASVLGVHEMTVSRHVSELIKNDWLLPFSQITETGTKRRLKLSENAEKGLAKTRSNPKQKRLEAVSKNAYHNKQRLINKDNNKKATPDFSAVHVTVRPYLEKWIQYRKEMNKPVKSELSMSAVITKINKHPPEAAIAMIENSIANGWQGLFPPKEQKQDKNPYKLH